MDSEDEIAPSSRRPPQRPATVRHPVGIRLRARDAGCSLDWPSWRAAGGDGHRACQARGAGCGPRCSPYLANAAAGAAATGGSRHRGTREGLVSPSGPRQLCTPWLPASGFCLSLHSQLAAAGAHGDAKAVPDGQAGRPTGRGRSGRHWRIRSSGAGSGQSGPSGGASTCPHRRPLPSPGIGLQRRSQRLVCSRCWLHVIHACSGRGTGAAPSGHLACGVPDHHRHPDGGEEE